ncbi:hypothetical protein DN748_02625 [Sinomicrobium soli]|nr:hypothetical protein DN748_02625 [Sinomicrobium sp. N-1-3-6]
MLLFLMRRSHLNKETFTENPISRLNKILKYGIQSKPVVSRSKKESPINSAREILFKSSLYRVFRFFPKE